jgi:hypothetical protein
MGRRAVRRLLGSLGLFACLGGERIAHAEEATLFSRTYLRGTGPPVETTDSVSLPAGVGTPFVLRVQNGLPDGSGRVSSATVKVNGVEVVRPSDLNQNVPELERPIEVSGNSVELVVRLASQPGSQLTLVLVGTPTGPRPEPPRDLLVTGTNAGHAWLDWEPSPSEDIVSYQIYRGAMPDELSLLGDVESHHDPKKGYRFIDKNLPQDTVTFYRVSAKNTLGIVSELCEFDAVFIKDPQTEHELRKFDPVLISFFEIAQRIPEEALPAIERRSPVITLSKTPPYRVLVVISVDADPIPQSYLDALSGLGARLSRPAPYGAVAASIPISSFEAVQDLPFVRNVSPLQGFGKFPKPQFPPAESFAEQKKIMGFDLLHSHGWTGSGTPPIRIANVEPHRGRHEEFSSGHLKLAAPEAQLDVIVTDEQEELTWIEVAENAAIAGNDVILIEGASGPSLFHALTLQETIERHPNVVFVVPAANEARNHMLVNMHDNDGDGYVDFLSGEPPVNHVTIQEDQGRHVIVFAYSPEKRGTLQTDRIDLVICPDGCCAEACDPRIYTSAIGNNELATRYAAAVAFNNDRLIAWKPGDEFRVRMGRRSDSNGDGIVDETDQYDNEGRSLHLLVQNASPHPEFGEIYDESVPLSINERRGSITGIAAVPGVLTVGASTLPRPDENVVGSSSRGPGFLPAPLFLPFPLTPSGIAKPDLVAIASSTSFSAPWVAGAAALLMQKYRADNPLGPGVPRTEGSPEEARFVHAKLRDLAKPLRLFPPGHSSDYGSGRLSLTEGGAWLYDGSTRRFLLVGPDGQMRQVPVQYSPSFFFFDLEAEPGSGALWAIDAISNQVVRIERDGRAAVLDSPDGTVFQNLAFSPPDRACWVAAARLPDIHDGVLHRVEHVPDPGGHSGGALLAAGSEPHPCFFFSLFAAPAHFKLWAHAACFDPSDPSVGGTGLWLRDPAGARLVYRSPATTTSKPLGVDARDGSAWLGDLDGLLHFSSEGELLLEQPNLARPRWISLDAETGDLWLTHTNLWLKRSPDLTILLTVLPVHSFGAGPALAGPADRSVWAGETVSLTHRFIRHWDQDGTPLQEYEFVQPINAAVGVAPWGSIPEVKDASPPEPPPVITSTAAGDPSAAGIPEELTGLIQEAESEGLSLQEWSGLSPANWLRFADAAREVREAQTD